MNTVQVALAHGIVEGRVDGVVRSFLSLPYAAPLTDERRFREPQPVEPWSGVRDATRPSPSAPQSPLPPSAEVDLEGLMGTAPPKGPDYLTLNVWAPDAAGAGRPVMVFIHGGSFVAGSQDAPVYDGSAFARDGVVCVAINYRVGIEGFLPIPGPPQGLADSIHALWIRFATDGQLPWPAYEAQTRQVYSLTRQVASHEPVMPAAAFLP